LFPRRQRFVVLSLLLVDTNKARVTTARRPFLREIFPPTERSSFCLGFCALQKDDFITTAHVVIMSFAKTNNLRRESREKGGRLFRRFLSRADGKKINTA